MVRSLHTPIIPPLLFLSLLVIMGVFTLSFSTRPTSIKPLESPWKQFTSYDNEFSLYYPSTWEYSIENSLSDSVPRETNTLTVHPKAITNEQLFSVMVTWYNYTKATDCNSLAHEHMQQTLDVHNASLSDPIGKSIQALFEPAQSITISKYSACQFPVSTSHVSDTTYRDEHYEIPWKGRLYGVRFQTADSPAEIILEPEKNNRIAHRILTSLRFSDETQSAASADNAIQAYARQKSSPSVREFIVTEKKTFIDDRGAVWMKFTVAPIPADAAEPSYGVMKQTYGKWEGRGFGTCCVESALPSEVQEGLGFSNRSDSDTLSP